MEKLPIFEIHEAFYWFSLVKIAKNIHYVIDSSHKVSFPIIRGRGLKLGWAELINAGVGEVSGYIKKMN